MLKQFDTQCVTLIPNDRGGWFLQSDGILDCRDYSELELEEEIERLLLEGWVLVGNINHRPYQAIPSQRDLYFRRETMLEEI
jgi:hypothetical protein